MNADLSLMNGKVDPRVLEMMPARIAHHFNAFPLREEDGALVVALSDPDPQHLDDLRQFLQRDVIPVYGSPDEIRAALKRYYGVGADTLEILNVQEPMMESSALSFDAVESLENASSESASIIKFVKELLLEALESRATDIHLEPYRDELRIRRRIDGVLYEAAAPAAVRRFQPEIISRVKVLANLDIAEKRLPQDGRIKVRLGESDIDLRVSILPTPFGESVTLRLLTSRAFLDLEHLGFSAGDMGYLESLLEKPHGIVLLTGPTGSGKTTTLYALLNKINKENNKIITIEDPIEYQMRGITQIQVHPKIGLDFAAGLRSMLRHDPDVMMVGEIRDIETAEIAIRVALTGHLVFSTLHTNDAPGAVARLLDMDLEPFLVASSLECVIAQRLVRLICRHCKTESRDEVCEPALRNTARFKGAGCDLCGFTGYKGRTVIYEILHLDRTIRDLILTRTSSDVIRRKALERGMKTLRASGWEKVAAGLTTQEEVLRATLKEEEP